MADHGAPEYATATGNDYGEHERTYSNVMKLTKVSTAACIAIVICLAVGGVGYSWTLASFGVVLTLAATAIGLASASGTVLPIVGVIALVLALQVLLG